MKLGPVHVEFGGPYKDTSHHALPTDLLHIHYIYVKSSFERRILLDIFCKKVVLLPSQNNDTASNSLIYPHSVGCSSSAGPINFYLLVYESRLTECTGYIYRGRPKSLQMRPFLIILFYQNNSIQNARHYVFNERLW